MPAKPQSDFSHILKVLALFCLFAILSPTSNVCGEDVEKSGISFAPILPLMNIRGKSDLYLHFP